MYMYCIYVGMIMMMMMGGEKNKVHESDVGRDGEEGQVRKRHRDGTSLTYR